MFLSTTSPHFSEDTIQTWSPCSWCFQNRGAGKQMAQPFPLWEWCSRSTKHLRTPKRGTFLKIISKDVKTAVTAQFTYYSSHSPLCPLCELLITSTWAPPSRMRTPIMATATYIKEFSMQLLQNIVLSIILNCALNQHMLYQRKSESRRWNVQVCMVFILLWVLMVLSRPLRLGRRMKTCS